MSAVRKVQGGNVMVEQMKMRGQEKEKESCGKVRNGEQAVGKDGSIVVQIGT